MFLFNRQIMKLKDYLSNLRRQAKLITSFKIIMWLKMPFH